MPIITLESGKLNGVNKGELIQALTQTASEKTHIPEQHFTVLIKEMPDDSVGVGGKTLTQIKAERK